MRSRVVGYEYVPHDNYYSQEFNVLSPTTGEAHLGRRGNVVGAHVARDHESITSTPPYTLRHRRSP